VAWPRIGTVGTGGRCRLRCFGSAGEMYACLLWTLRGGLGARGAPTTTPSAHHYLRRFGACRKTFCPMAPTTTTTLVFCGIFGVLGAGSGGRARCRRWQCALLFGGGGGGTGSGGRYCRMRLCSSPRASIP
jgi:hypothetical protein